MTPFPPKLVSATPSTLQCPFYPDLTCNKWCWGLTPNDGACPARPINQREKPHRCGSGSCPGHEAPTSDCNPMDEADFYDGSDRTLPA